jgi:hypothetical protein
MNDEQRMLKTKIHLLATLSFGLKICSVPRLVSWRREGDRRKLEKFDKEL